MKPSQSASSSTQDFLIALVAVEVRNHDSVSNRDNVAERVKDHRAVFIGIKRLCYRVTESGGSSDNHECTKPDHITTGGKTAREALPNLPG